MSQFDNFATEMYSTRVAQDQDEGKGNVYITNPEARRMYFMGVHDVLVTMNVFANSGCSPGTINELAEKLHDQTCEHGHGGTAYPCAATEGGGGLAH